jgi:surfactin synthase thioesterase subunit
MTALPLPASAWNITGHMLSAAIAYQVLQHLQRSTLRKHY